MLTVKTQLTTKWVGGSIGTAAILCFWWLGSVTIFAPKGAAKSGAIPTPFQVVEQFASDGVEFYFRNAWVTLAEAGIGFFWGNLAAIALAALALTLPKLENVAMQLAVITYSIPLVAIGPIIRLVVGAPASGEPAEAAIALAALAVFFTTMVGVMTGVKSAEKTSLDVVTVYGGSAWDRLVKVQLMVALPSTLAALRIAAPAAFLGAILGEYVGGPDVGFGPAMVNAQQSLEIARVWGLALASGAIAGAAYAAIGLVSRFVTPWSKGSVTSQ